MSKGLPRGSLGPLGPHDAPGFPVGSVTASREPGYYWLLFKGAASHLDLPDSQWEPAFWNGREWLTIGSEVPHNDNEDFVIGARFQMVMLR